MNESEIIDDIEDEHPARSIDLIALIAIIAIVSDFFADTVVAFAVHRFKGLRRKLHNRFIYHGALVSAANRLTMVLFFVLVHGVKGRNSELKHLIVDVIGTFYFAESVLTTLMGIGWYLEAYIPRKWATFKKHTTNQLVAIYFYTISVILYSLLMYLTSTYPGFLSVLLLVLNYVISLTTLSVFGSIHLCRRKQTNAFPLKLALFKYLLWLPLFLSFVSIVILRNPHVVRYLFVSFLLLALFGPVFQLLVSCAWDGRFAEALAQLFTCNRVDGEGADELEESVDEEGAIEYVVGREEVLEEGG